MKFNGGLVLGGLEVNQFFFREDDLDVSKNSGTPKSSIKK